jgi:hypothetical protein
VKNSEFSATLKQENNMKFCLNTLDRRRFLRGAGLALALPLFESVAAPMALGAGKLLRPEEETPKRLACFYFPDGVPMPLPEDPAHQDWFWFPKGSGRDFELSKCLEPLKGLRDELTVLSGFSHPNGRNIHGHCNADQFLTAANLGQTGPYKNTISLDQVYAEHVGNQTRFSSLVMSTDGGVGTPRGAQTLSFNRSGRAIPAEHRPKNVFDMLFVKSDQDAARRLALSKSALDDLLDDALSLRRSLSNRDQASLDEYLESVREAEKRVEKAKQWIHTPLPKVDGERLNLNLTPDQPREYVQVMFELIFLAFKTDSTRVATYQLGRENGVGISDHLARAVGFNLSHQLSHETKNPGGWKNFGIYCQFLNEEYGRFAQKLKDTPEPAGPGCMLDNTLLIYGSASSAFHLSRNYPIVMTGGKNMGFKHGQYINHAGANPQGGAWKGGREPWQKEISQDDKPLSNVFATVLQQLGVETESFADSDATVTELV